MSVRFSGRLADIVLWPRASFGAKPWMVIKSGYVAWSAMGDGNASQIGSEPILQKPMWGRSAPPNTTLALPSFRVSRSRRERMRD